jgi:hypothetical protein
MTSTRPCGCLNDRNDVPILFSLQAAIDSSLYFSFWIGGRPANHGCPADEVSFKHYLMKG